MTQTLKKKILMITAVCLLATTGLADGHSLVDTFGLAGVTVSDSDTLASIATREPDFIVTQDILSSTSWATQSPSYLGANQRLLSTTEAITLGDYVFLSDQNQDVILADPTNLGEKIQLWDICWVFPWACKSDDPGNYDLNPGIDDFLGGQAIEWNDRRVNSSVDGDFAYSAQNFIQLNDRIAATVSEQGQLFLYSENPQGESYLWSPLQYNGD